jgi:hypothetical protein
MVPLVRDVLDKQVVDVKECKVGKVDGIVLALRTHRPPRVIAIEMDQATLWRRVHGTLGDWVDRLQKKFEPGRFGPTRILFGHVISGGIDVHLDIDCSHTHALLWERWLGKHVIGRIPGGRRGGTK